VDVDASNLDPQTWPKRVVGEKDVAGLQLQHLHAGKSIDGDGRERLSGFVLWSCKVRGGGPVGVRWDWAEVLDRVLAISDPLAMRTNMSLVDEAGVSLPNRIAILQLNLLVYVLDWQGAVLKEIERIGLRATVLACRWP
jgi:hypothetical protein